MGLPNRQRGLTAISWMVVLTLVGILGFGVIKLVPVYIEHFSVSTTLDSLRGEQPNGPAAIREAVARRFSINNVSSVTANELSVVPQGGSYQVSLAYEVRVPFLGNLSLLVGFDDAVEVPTR